MERRYSREPFETSAKAPHKKCFVILSEGERAASFVLMTFAEPQSKDLCRPPLEDDFREKLSTARGRLVGLAQW